MQCNHIWYLYIDISCSNTNESPTYSLKEIFPTVVSAEKFGNTSPRLIPMIKNEGMQYKVYAI